MKTMLATALTFVSPVAPTVQAQSIHQGAPVVKGSRQVRLNPVAIFALTAASLIGVATAAAAETFTVVCGSAGQICDATAMMGFRSAGPGVEYGVTLKAPTTHCSAVRYLVYSNDGQRRFLGRTQFLSAGQWSYVSLGSNLAHGRQTVLIGAEGQVGGCNTGRVQSWGVEAKAQIVPR